MKIILTCLLAIVLSLDLFGRMNPFETTDTYNEKKAEFFKQIELKKQQEAKVVEDERKRKQEELAQIEKAKEVEALKQEKQEQLELQRKAKEKMVKKETFNILPFVKVEVINNVLVVTVDPKYKLINQDILKESNKYLFDFRGDLSFYTVRRDIEHKDFKSFAVGTHKKKKFFRVVIDMSDKISLYKEKVLTKKGIVTIQKLAQ